MTQIFAIGLGLALLLSGSITHAGPEVFDAVHKFAANNQIPEALAALKTAAEKESSDDIKGLSYLYAGILLFQNEKYQEAVELLEQAAKKPSRIDEYIHYYLGLSKLNLKEYAGAKKELESLKQKAGSAFMFESRFGLAQIAIAEKNWRVASINLEFLERKARSHLRYPEVLWNLMIVERAQNRKWKVCRLAEKLYTKYPAYSQIQDWGIDLQNNSVNDERLGCTATLKDQQTRIRRLQWAGQSDRARTEIETLEKRTVPATQFIVDRILAQYLMNEGFVEDALRLYMKHYDEQKGSFTYLTALGNAAARAGEMQAAIGAYYGAYKMSPRSKNGREALFQAAFLSYRFQDYDGAGRKFQELVDQFPRTGLARDAKWHLAWLRYLKGDYKGAYSSFSALMSKRSKKGSERDFSNEKMQYWMAMSLMKQQEHEKARSLFAQLSNDRLLGYYSIAARYRLAQLNRKDAGKKVDVPLEATASLDKEADVEDSESEEALTTQNPAAEEDEEEAPAEPTEEKVQATSFADPLLAKRFDRVRDLRAIGLEDWMKWELYEIERRTRNTSYLRMLMTEYEASQVFNRSSYIGQTFFSPMRAKQGMEGARALWESTYPKAYVSFVTASARSYSIPEELVWGIMRAESQYRVDVTSPVGALGLMQLMPFTARQVASLINLNDFKTRMLVEPETNIKLGTRYLQRLMEKFGRQVPLAAAAYNAGPHRVEEWLYSFGNLEMDEFIEHIPFVETRNYVKKVSRNYQIYRELYSRDKTPLIYLTSPITVKVAAPPSTREVW